ncbi:MAG: glycoside hydrolase family 19 protein [Planktothrix sp.]
MKKAVLILLALIVAIPVFAGTGTVLPTSEIEYLMYKIFKAVFPTLTTTQRSSISAIVKAFSQYGDGDNRKLIYIIALAWHESRLRPIKEIKAKVGTEVWEKYQKNYWPSGYYGRGFVQLTWKGNYEKMSDFLGVDLVNNPDLALNQTYAAQIIVYGMMNGSFTGKKLSDYINGNKADYYNARRTVGAIMVAGKDTAQLIEGYTEAALSQIS